MVYCVGLTGTIASGKSTVAQEFARLGIDIISADQISKELTKTNEPALQKIIEHFGQSLLTSTGELNRQHLREIIFNRPTERHWLENLLHPLIRKRIEQKTQHCTSPYCIIEIPLLTDKKSYPYLNRVLLILAQREQQISRLKQRDQSSKEQALAILKVQADEATLRALADDIIMNNGSVEDLQEHVIRLHEQYLGS